VRPAVTASQGRRRGARLWAPPPALRGRLLAHHGARIVASPESFLVEGLTGALAGGELGRARAWGERLTRSDCIRGVAGRRRAS